MKVDMGFLAGMGALFSSGPPDPQQEAIAFQADCKLLDNDLMADMAQASDSEQKHFYDQLHFSPLKVCADVLVIIVCLTISSIWDVYQCYFYTVYILATRFT